MRMDFWICLFTGLVSMLEYSFLGIYSVLLKDIAFNNIQFPISITNHITLALYCLIGSLLTGLVTIDIKKRVNNSFKYIDERNMFLNMFGQHVSPEVVEKLISHKTEQVSEIRNVCVMFLDIRNFTKFSENKDPEYIVNYLNILFDSMIEIISRNNGIINKFLGDGFMAIFGAPLSSGNDSLNAVHSAVEIIRDIEIKNKNGIIQETNVGIGIHYGKVLTGHIGSSKRKEYTIIGDTVNLASRIEGLNKQYNSKILISEDVYSQVKESITQISFMEEVFVKGKEKPIRIYRLD
jgi:adenylate cyclase